MSFKSPKTKYSLNQLKIDSTDRYKLWDQLLSNQPKFFEENNKINLLFIGDSISQDLLFASAHSEKILNIFSSKIDVVILAGGKGSRIKKYLNNSSKPMINFGGRPFIDYIIKKVSSYPINHIHIMAGYKGNRIYKKYNKTYKDNVFEYKGYTIWGMTGKILSSFLKEIETYF